MDEQTIRHRKSMMRQRGKRGRAKRTELQREMDYVDEANLYLRGYTYQSIAEWIGEHREYDLTPSMIGMDLKRVRERWQNMYLRDVDDVKAQELARIDRIEREAWEAWDKSKLDITETKALSKTDSWGEANKKPTYNRKEIQKITKNRDPYTRFIEIVQWCVEQRMKIFGLDAPKTVNVNWRQEAISAGIDNPDMFVDGLANEFIEAARKNKNLAAED